VSTVTEVASVHVPNDAVAPNIERMLWARSVAIVAHGKPGNVAAFYRRREEALA